MAAVRGLKSSLWAAAGEKGAEIRPKRFSQAFAAQKEYMRQRQAFLVRRVKEAAAKRLWARLEAEHPTLLVSDRPCNIRREGGQSLVIGGPSLVILEGTACNPW